MTRTARILLTLAVLFCAAAPRAGEISAELQSQVANKAAGERVRVWIKGTRSREEAGLKKSLAAASNSRAERHRMGIAELKAENSRRQQGLLQRLDQMKAGGQADKIKGHWLANVVEAEVTIGQLAALAARNDVDIIYPVPQLELIEPSNPQPVPTSPQTVVPNLSTINAPAAWAAGYTGQGRVICSFDTGIDGDHVALYNNWKGLDGDSAAAWFDPQDQLPFPHIYPGTATYYHGTHVMGILCGHNDATGDTIGVALDARWISAAVIDILGTPIIDAFEWAADPDGDPNTIADVPDVVNHSWGIKGIGCENIFYDLIDNLEALGIVNIFAAGNEGATSFTIRNPANRALDSLDNFAVGNLTTQTVPPTIYLSSSRGPSDCNGAIKPNVCAPGYAIQSAAPNDVYTTLTGTSMAAPHVSGLVALLRQKNPDATPDEIKEAILTSTDHLGQSLPNNNYGWGMIDCMAALNALPGPPATPVIRVYSYDYAPILPGSTVDGSLMLKNLGGGASSVSVTVTGADPSLSVLNGSASFGTIGSADTVRSATHIQFLVSDTVTSGRLLSADIQITATGYATNGKLYVLVEPATEREQYDLGINRCHYTITNWGTYGLGPLSFFPFHGIGFTVDTSSYNEIYESGFVAAIGAASVSDGLRNSAGEPDGDFAVSPGGNLSVMTPGPRAAQETVGKFNDSRALNPFGIHVELHTYAFDDPGDENFIILQYILSNPGPLPIAGLVVGQYFDWDVVFYGTNCGGWNPSDSASWVAYHNTTPGVDTIGTYRGVRVVDGPIASCWTADAELATYYGSSDGFTEQEKWDALNSGFVTANTYNTSAVDITQMVSIGPLYLAAGGVDTVAFAVLIGDNPSQFSQASIAAKDAYDNRVLSCCVGLRGNVDGDPLDEVNISDLTYLVAALFQGGEPPACTAEANVDADALDAINVSDLTYLVATLFQAGAEPLPCGQYSN